MVFQRRWLGLPVVLVLVTACGDRHDPSDARSSAVPTAHAPAPDAVDAGHRSDCPGAQASQKAHESPPGLHRIDASDATELDAGPDAAPLCLEVGQALRVGLPGSPATGYGWVLEQGALPQLSLEIVPGVEPTRLRTRAGVMHSWVFRAERPGHARLRFAYRRSWDTEPARFAEFNVTVR